MDEMTRRYHELNELMAQPEVISDLETLHAYAREQSGMSEVVDLYARMKDTESALAETEALLLDEHDPEMADMVREEVASLRTRRDDLWARIRDMLTPKDPNDEKNVIVEICAGTGGEEAALFAGDLYRMYARYAELHRYQLEVMSSTATDLGGFREIIFEVRGRGAYSKLKYESGVHRVQRVPATEASGKSTRPPRRSWRCPKRRTWKWTSRKTISALTCTAPPVTAGSASTRPTRPCASRTSPPEPS